ncbi:MAG: hypothetical protein G01um101433_309 [Parcubacteria group bacterium Gr01-1014_33]|nr:MAG: hypothetical protein G01um101433_309 [Parcubacteria group bacterium Gr01-1014_33]
MRNPYSRDKGFTLVELLVVISIISILSSVVLTSVNSARNKAKYARANAEINQFVKAATVAQGESAMRLQDITGSACSYCVCGGRDLRNVPTTDGCYTQWVNDLNAIQAATNGTVSGIDRMMRDPWGSPYLLDENEREYGPTDCRFDTVASAGPDGFLQQDGPSCTGIGDGICFLIPSSRPCP